MDVTTDLLHYLQQGREGLLSRLDDLGEFDVRRPMTPTATNLLGLVKHVAGVELEYLGNCVGRPAPVTLPWVEDGSIWDGADMWATADETREEIVELYRLAWRHGDATVRQLGLDAPGHVPWWPEGHRDTTLGHLLTRVVAETAQHAGHADIIRELIDGRAGQDHDSAGDEAWWRAYYDRIREAAETYRTA